MSTGYWWNGHRYYETEARRAHAWLLDHSLALSIRSADRDPQLWRDYTWQLVAAVTVVPVAAVPLLFAGGAIYAATAGSALSLVLLVCSLAGPLSPGGSSLPSPFDTSPRAPAPQPRPASPVWSRSVPI